MSSVMASLGFDSPLSLSLLHSLPCTSRKKLKLPVELFTQTWPQKSPPPRTPPPQFWEVFLFMCPEFHFCPTQNTVVMKTTAVLKMKPIWIGINWHSNFFSILLFFMNYKTNLQKWSGIIIAISHYQSWYYIIK